MRQYGFTLLELTIVLFIAGILMTGGLKVFTAMVKNTGIPETRQSINRVDHALLAHVLADTVPYGDPPILLPVYYGYNGDEDEEEIVLLGPCDCSDQDNQNVVPSRHVP